MCVFIFSPLSPNLFTQFRQHFIGIFRIFSQANCVVLNVDAIRVICFVISALVRAWKDLRAKAGVSDLMVLTL